MPGYGPLFLEEKDSFQKVEDVRQEKGKKQKKQGKTRKNYAESGGNFSFFVSTKENKTVIIPDVGFSIYFGHSRIRYGIHLMITMLSFTIAPTKGDWDGRLQKL